MMKSDLVERISASKVDDDTVSFSCCECRAACVAKKKQDVFVKIALDVENTRDHVPQFKVIGGLCSDCYRLHDTHHGRVTLTQFP